MTATNEFHMVPLDQITVGKRAREDLGDVQSLADSIKSIGLLHPIVVQRATTKRKVGKKHEPIRTYKLVAGGRRLAAVHLLKWDLVACHFYEDLSEDEAKAIELEENLKRQDLSWDEECLAIRSLHELKTRSDPDWTQAQTAELIGISQEWVSRRLTVAEAIASEDPTITDAVGANAAYNILQRRGKRALDDTVADMQEVEAELEDPTPSPKGVFEIIESDCLRWDYHGKKFNLIHCDFPYGLDHASSAQGQSSSWQAPYEDSEETYWRLIEGMAKSHVISDSAHLIFWFSMKHYYKTASLLANAGWRIDPFPLIWHKSDNKGILPDPNRGPRRVYETAFLGSRGDRSIVRPVSNVISFPVGVKQHLSEKPFEVVQYFLKMLVDGNSRLLDPTCGSGTALAAAKTLGAQYVIGLDIDPDSVALAARNLKTARPENRDDSGGDLATEPETSTAHGGS